MIRPYIVTATMLVVGWSVAVVVYFTATPDEADPLRTFHESKKYEADVERFGGKAAVFSNEVTQWVAGLFRGQTLALTIAVITAVVALGYLYRATRSDDGDEQEGQT